MPIEALLTMVAILVTILIFLYTIRKERRNTQTQGETLGEDNQMTFAALAINNLLEEEREEGTIESEEITFDVAHLHARVYEEYNAFSTGRNITLPKHTEDRYVHSLNALESALAHYQEINAIMKIKSYHFEIFRQITKDDIPDATRNELKNSLLGKFPDSSSAHDLTKPIHTTAKANPSDRGSSSIEEDEEAAQQDRERKLEDIEKWEPYLAQFGNDKVGNDHRLQVKRVARKWVEYTIAEQISADRTSQDSLAHFLDTHFKINANTRSKYSKIINDWFVAIEKVDEASSREPRRKAKEDKANMQRVSSSVPGTLRKGAQKEKLVGFILEGEQYECNSAKEVLVAILKLLQERDSQFLDRLSQASTSQGCKTTISV